MAKNINNFDEFQKVVNNNAKLVDMRSPIDYRDGTIFEAENLPYRNLVNSVGLFDKKQKLVVLIDKTKDREDLNTVIKYAELAGIDQNKIYFSDYHTLLKSKEKSELTQK